MHGAFASQTNCPDAFDDVATMFEKVTFVIERVVRRVGSGWGYSCSSERELKLTIQK